MRSAPSHLRLCGARRCATSAAATAATAASTTASAPTAAVTSMPPSISFEAVAAITTVAAIPALRVSALARRVALIRYRPSGLRAILAWISNWSRLGRAGWHSLFGDALRTAVGV